MPRKVERRRVVSVMRDWAGRKKGFGTKEEGEDVEESEEGHTMFFFFQELMFLTHFSAVPNHLYDVSATTG